MSSRTLNLHVINLLMFRRIGLSLALLLAVLAAPIAPLDLKAAFTSKMTCSIRVPMDPCHGCPINSSQTNSNAACCSAQAPCFVSFANSDDDLVAGVRMNAFHSFTNDRILVRAQRPPVPPPRFALS